MLANYLFGILSECAAILMALAVTPTALVDRNPKKIPCDTQKVTIISHGFLHNRSVDVYWRAKMSGIKELGPIYTLNLGHPFQSIEEYTQTLRQLILQIQNRIGDDRQLQLNLIGHSMGGLVCTNYAVNFAALDGVQVIKIITVATPFQGTGTAYLASPFCPCAREMLPNSAFLQKLKTQVQTLDKSIFFQIGCGLDIIVNKNRTSFTEKSDYIFPYYGHTTPLFSSKVVNLIREKLEMP